MTTESYEANCLSKHLRQNYKQMSKAPGQGQGVLKLISFRLGVPSMDMRPPPYHQPLQNAVPGGMCTRSSISSATVVPGRGSQ